VNLTHAILCDNEGITQAHGCLRHETDRGVERWHCTIYCFQFCAGFNDAKWQHLSIINTNSDLSFTTIQKQTYRRKQLMDQSDDNSLTVLLTKRAQVRFREVVNTCTERRAEKRIQRTAWILSHVLRTTLCEHVNSLYPAGWLSEQSITKHWFRSVRICTYSWATGCNTPMFSKITALFYIALEPLRFLCFRCLISQINWFKISTKSSGKNIPNIHLIFHKCQIQNLYSLRRKIYQIFQSWYIQ